MRVPFLTVSLAFFALLPGVGAFASDCAALASISMPQATLTSTTLIAAGPFTVLASKQAPAQQFVLPSFCRVQGIAKPAIRFELWMPAHNWNGRLLSLGNGGFGGSIDLGQLAQYLLKGYAVTANDTGHVGDGTQWMHDSEALLAWGHNATHRVIEPVKSLVHAYYGKPQASERSLRYKGETKSKVKVDMGAKWVHPNGPGSIRKTEKSFTKATTRSIRICWTTMVSSMVNTLR